MSNKAIYSIIFLGVFFIFLILIVFFAIQKRIKLKKNGGIIPTQSPQQMPGNEQFVFRNDKEPEFITPKEVQPYEFFCTNCNEKSLGYSIYCPKCGVRMKLLSSAFQEGNKHKDQDKSKCVLCHSEMCPICKKSLIGESACYEECPFCERKYHEHCWANTIQTTGKCSFCLEAPPPDMMMDKY
ncbi:MAG: hypothetical protein ACFFBP_04545 [Promethearchaeota archaeon]